MLRYLYAHKFNYDKVMESLVAYFHWRNNDLKQVTITPKLVEALVTSHLP